MGREENKECGPGDSNPDSRSASFQVLDLSPGASAALPVGAEPPSSARQRSALDFEPATSAHCAALAPLLRPEDVAEAEAMMDSYAGPLDCLTRSVAMSKASWAAVAGSRVVAMFGVVPFETQALEPPSALIWFVTGNGFPAHALSFSKAVRRLILPALLEQYGALSNFVDARYEAAVRFARWLGFTVGEAVPFGPRGLLFHPARLEVL